MLFHLIKSIAIWVLATAAFCLVVGLIQMYRYEVTIESVEHKEFQLIYSVIENGSIKTDAELNKVLKIMGVLNYMFPMAIITEDNCWGNMGKIKLCDKYPDAKYFEEIKNNSKNRVETTKYGLDVLIVERDETYYLKKLPDDEAWLIGEGTKYLLDEESSGTRQLYFIKNRTYFYLFTRDGLGDLLYRNLLIWIVTFVISFAIWVSISLYRFKTDKALSLASESIKILEIALANKNDNLYRLELERQNLLAEIESSASEDEIINLKKALEEKDSQVGFAESEYYKAEEEKELMEERIKGLSSKLSMFSKQQEIERTYKEFQDLKSLWLKHISWIERYQVEYEVATHTPEKAPFTSFVAFVGFERFLKMECRKYQICVEDNVGRISRLYDENKITASHKDLLHEARIARNDWIHSGKSPDHKMLKRLLEFLIKKEVQPKL